MRELDLAFHEWVGAPLFRTHEATDEILRNIHRFRAIDRPGLLSLAKDVARLTADRIDVRTLKQIVEPPKDQTWRSLRFLEEVLATLTKEHARGILTPLAGVYELRLGDAHLPSGKIEEAFAMVKIDPAAIPIEQGRQLLFAVVQSLVSVLYFIPGARK
jgi:hypothetical protein